MCVWVCVLEEEKDRRRGEKAKGKFLKIKKKYKI